jgi:hypothetical protein
MSSHYRRMAATPTGFAASHCQNCAMGWTRTGQDGALTICLLDREPVLSEMTSCDRYEPREEAQQRQG